MIISHKHKFIYIHPHKCAGSSITESLLPHLGDEDIVVGVTNDGESLESNKGKWQKFKHAPASRIKQVVGDEVWANYFKFSFVRNPFDRCVSWYFWLLGDNAHKRVREMSFEEWVISCFGDEQAVINESWTKLCFTFSGMLCKEGVPQTNFIGFYETLQRDFDKVCDMIGIERKKLDKVNATKRGLHGSYYSKKSIDLVSEFFADDISMYNYTFNGRSL